MTRWLTSGRAMRTWVSSCGLLAAGGCGLSDQQTTQIISSVLTSGLTALVSALTAGLFSQATTV